MPERYGKWKSVYDRFRRWRKDRTIDSILERLHRKLDEAGRIDHELWCIDATSIRASRSAAGARREGPADEPSDHALGRSRGGFGTKLHLIVDGHGIPLSVSASPGQAHESKHVEPVLEAVRLPRPGRGRPRRRPRRLAGDKGYSYPRVRRYLRRRGIVAVIPTRKDQRRNPRFDTQVYRRRNVVERCVNWLKESRRLGTAPREAGGPLRGHGQVGHDPAVPAALGFIRQALAVLLIKLTSTGLLSWLIVEHLGPAWSRRETPRYNDAIGENGPAIL